MGGVTIALCVTITRSPATAIAPTRCAPSFGAIVTATLPLPRPVGVETVIHATSEAALHEQASFVRTSICDGPPEALTGSLGWFTSKRQAAACCVSSTRPSLTRTAPARGVGSGLLSMRNVTLPVPCPCGDDVIATQPTADVADHVHSGDTVTDTEVAPPSGPNVRVDAARLGSHRDTGVDGAMTLVVADPPHPDTPTPKTRATATSRKQL